MSGQRILMKGRMRQGGRFFHRESKCDTGGQSGATHSAAAVALMVLLIFLLHTPQQ